MRFIRQVTAKIITDRERAENAKKHAKDIVTMKPGSLRQSYQEPAAEKKRPPSFLREVKDVKEAKKFQKEVKDLSKPGSVKIFLDIDDQGTIYSGKRPFAKHDNTHRKHILHWVGELGQELQNRYGMPDLRWSAGSDGTDGIYTGESFEVPTEDMDWKYFDNNTKAAFSHEDTVTLQPVLHLEFKHLTGNELKEGVAASSPSDPVSPSYMGPASKDYEHVIPIEHFDEFSDGKGNTQWSIQTDQTHGIKGLVKVSKTKLEDPGLSLKGNTPQTTRRAGSENLFLGSRKAVVDFVKENYPKTTKVKFV